MQLEGALCESDAGRDLFIRSSAPGHNVARSEAQALCATCPALAPCTDFALTPRGRQVPGILAGLTATQRPCLCEVCGVQLTHSPGRQGIRCKQHPVTKTPRYDWAAA